MKPFERGICLARLRKLFQAALLFSAACSATASYDSPRIINPHTNTSPSGKFTCEVDPTDRYGRGEAKYRLLQNGSIIWQGLKPFTLVECGVTDDGVVAGYGYTYGENGFSERGFKAGAGDFVVALIDSAGGLRLHQTYSRRGSQFLHDLPNPLAHGMILDARGDRFIVRVRDADVNRSRESWWTYEIDSGKKTGEFELFAGDGKSASPIRIAPVPGTPLILVHYWRYDHPDASARFALLDSGFKEIWSTTWWQDYNVDGNEAAEDRLRAKIWAEGAILDTGKSNRFTLFSAKKSEEVSFSVQRDPRDDGKWIVTEIERRKHNPAPDAADKPLPSKTNALAVLGTFSLETSQSAQSELFRDVVEFGFDGAGNIGMLRRGKKDDYKFTFVETNGALIGEVALPNPTRPDFTREVGFAWSTQDQWIVTSSELGPGGKTVAWWLNARTGKLEALSDLAAPAVERLVAAPGGGFIALCVCHSKYHLEHELIAFNRRGTVRWRINEDYRNDQALFGTEDIAVTSGGQVAVLDNSQHRVQFFDLQTGAFIRSIGLEKAWGRNPNCPSSISPEQNGGVLVYDFQGSPPVVRMNAEGKVFSQFGLKHKDGRALDPIYGVRVSPTGRVWVCDGASLARVTDKGIADLVLGSVPDGAALGGIAGLSVDQKGQLYAADKRSGEVHVFDQEGCRLRVCTPLNTDFAEQLTRADIAINDQEEVFLSSGDSFPETPTYVHFSPDGKRVGTRQIGLDNIQERWYPLPATNRILVVGYEDVFIVDADGKVQRRIARQPNGMWLEHPDSASIAADGSFAVVRGGWLQGCPFFVNLYSADGSPIRTVTLPAACMRQCFAYTGKYLATCTESSICLFSLQGDPVLQFKYPLENQKEHWWKCYSTKGGQELWMISSGLKEVCRFGLP